MSTLTTPAHSTLLRAHRGWRPLDLAELWRYRELLAFLALRELQVRYRQMALGAAWAIIQPLLTMVVFTVFFGYLGGFRARSDKPYAVLTFCALLGSVIGDLVTVSSARAVFIAGGILPRLKDFLPHSAFHARLLDKGVMHAALERVPVRLIENERLGVIGAASWYLEHLSERGA